MGKGDRKTKKGKIARGSFGVSRPRVIKGHVVPEEPKAEKPKQKKAPAKKGKSTKEENA